MLIREYLRANFGVLRKLSRNQRNLRHQRRGAQLIRIFHGGSACSFGDLSVRHSCARMNHRSACFGATCCGRSARRRLVYSACQSRRRAVVYGRDWQCSYAVAQTIFAAHERRGRFFAMEGECGRGRFKRKFRCALGNGEKQSHKTRFGELYRLAPFFRKGKPRAERFYLSRLSAVYGKLPYERGRNILAVSSTVFPRGAR